ncbi:MAG: GntR family transcriptional regulator [Ruminococcus sp.]|uniref:GntR family transcriptional regulator n=1 Tax=Ruminococcus sp. TaxID=41978 RepID=UPI0025CCAFA3|nr:GntR family transcriptional regulator [Ruminococcus sp.]MBR5683331.1 GntR family transcriptional regulator [Ruminococcus sp.]
MEDYKYLAIVEWAKNYIASKGLRPRDRFLTEKELCEIHGVSRQTVRQALMCLENDNVICRVRGSGAFVSGGYSQSVPVSQVQTRNIGVISTYFTDYIFPQIVTGIESVLNDSGYSMQLAITHNKVAEEQQALQSMISGGVQGLIVEPSKSALPNPNMALYDELRSKNIPVVFFNANYPWSGYPCVALDDEAAGRMAADYLFDCGHTKIAGLFALDDIQGHKRYSGFIKSCIAHGLKNAEENVMWFATTDKNFIFTSGGNRLLEFLSETTAVVCYNDNIAIKLLQFCKEHDISVPDDLSIVGTDDSKYASICDVPLTTIIHPQRKLGEAVAEKLIDGISSFTAENDDIIFTPELKIRDSVKKL